MWRLRLSKSILALCILLSAGGVYVAVHITHNETDAGRGGAIADALALGVMFLDRSYASRLYAIIKKFQQRTEQNDPSEAVDSAMVLRIARQEVGSALELVNADGRNQKMQNIYLAIATFAGTLTWGFGDLVARLFLPCQIR